MSSATMPSGPEGMSLIVTIIIAFIIAAMIAAWAKKKFPDFVEREMYVAANAVLWLFFTFGRFLPPAPS